MPGYQAETSGTTDQNGAAQVRLPKRRMISWKITDASGMIHRANVLFDRERESAFGRWVDLHSTQEPGSTTLEFRLLKNNAKIRD